MHVVVLGAGVTGVCTAYYLTQRGHQVTLIDRAPAVASGASHANAGQLSYSFTDAMARPEFLRTLPRIVLGADPAIRIGSLANPALLTWGARFLTQCTRAKARRNSTKMLQLALRSAALLEKITAHTGIDFDHQRAGKIVLLRTQRDVDNAAATCEHKQALGCDVRTLSLAEAIQIEPAIAHLDTPFAGAIYSANDAVADARLFCERLVTWLQTHTDTTVRLRHNVTKLVTENEQIIAVDTDQGEIKANATVVCLGAHSAPLLRPHEVRIHIYPVRGYSLTLEATQRSPRVSLTDLSSKIVFSRVGNSIRIAGLADFVGHSQRTDVERIATLASIAQTVAPHAANYASHSTQPWGGMRPMTPTGYPYLGPTRVGGLHLNTGHGMLGWTTACASAADVAGHIGSATHSSLARPPAESICAK